MTTLPRRLLAAHAAVAAVGSASMIAAAVVLARVGASGNDVWLAVAIWSLIALSGASLLFLIFAVRRVSIEMTAQVQRVVALAEAGKRLDQRDAGPNVAEFEQLGTAVLRASARLTARREAAEADLASERRRLAAMVRTLPIGLVIVDAAGRVALCNAAGGALIQALGVAAPCEVGELIAPALVARVAEDAGSTRTGPRLVRTAESRVLEIDDHALDQTGDRLWVLRDVTEERTLAQRRTHFLLRTAHELRTPLTSLGMAIGVLRAHCDGTARAHDPSVSQHVGEAAQDSVQRLNRLTERLLRWGALTLQPAAAEPEAVAWPRLAYAISGHAEAWAQRYGKPLQIDADDIGSDVRTVPELLLALLDEVFDNAFRAARTSGGVQLAMHAQGDDLTISVRDHGAGMNAAARLSWQSPLAQPGPRPGDGAGLGLAIAAELARVIGAELHIEPEQPGTRVDVRLPLRLANHSVTVPAHRTGAANASG